MKKVSLSGSLREGVGKKDAAALRANGRVPAVLYGGEKQVHFHVSAIELGKIIFTSDVYQIELDIEGTKYNTIIQETQFHPVSDKPVHVDFLQLFEDKKVKVQLPVRTYGASKGVLLGGKLVQNFRKLTVYGLPSAMPETIEIDITNLGIGNSVRVRDIQLPNAILTDAAEAVVVAVKIARGVVDISDDDEDVEGDDSAETSEKAAESEAV